MTQEKHETELVTDWPLYLQNHPDFAEELHKPIREAERALFDEWRQALLRALDARTEKEKQQ